MSKMATKLDQMAERLESDIAAKRRDRRENTPKQVKEARAAAIEADHLDRVRNAMVCLSNAIKSGTLPAEFSGTLTKTDLLSMLRTRIDCPSYYVIRDTGKYSDESSAAVRLRDWLASQTTSKNDDGRQAIKEMERDIKFRPIAGFFPTPPELCAQISARCELTKPFMRVLEPSAGKGDLAEAMGVDEHGRPTHAVVHVCEINRTLGDILRAKGFEFIGEDFLAIEPAADESGRYDRVVMNPPFEGLQDIDHVMHASRFLRDGGRLVSIMSPGAFFRMDKKAVAFRSWFDEVGGEKDDIEAGAFKNGFRSTGVGSVMVTVDAMV